MTQKQTQKRTKWQDFHKLKEREQLPDLKKMRKHTRIQLFLSWLGF